VTFRSRLFLTFGRLSAHLPPIRGRTRIFLELYRLLGLQHEPVRVRTRLRHPLRFHAELDLRSWLQRIAFLTGGYEADTVSFLRDLRRRMGGGYLLDVGANVGLISVPFALLDGAVVAVEAVPDNVGMLRRNITLNDAPVTVVPVALGEARKTVRIQVEGDWRAGEGSGTANILPAGSTYACVTQEIVVETLDAIATEGVIPDRCAVIKIDTDGYDLKVLQGGRAFLERNRPVIFGEFSAHCLAWHEQSIEDVRTFAAGLQYDVWCRVPRSWCFRRDVQPYDIDALLVPRERVDAFSSLLED
jgi:FkbM family methyltransferase